jgi:hypothetical protein
MLSRFWTVSAFEMDDGARQNAMSKTNGLYDIRAGFCPNSIPFEEEKFELSCLFDVLEHTDQENETLINLRGLLSS